MLAEAEHVLHDRTRLACEAAVEAGLPGTFETWVEDGLLAVLATAPELRFLRTISGIVAVFLRILLEGYEGDDVVTAFISAEHADPRIRRSLLLEDGVPISAAAMTSHGDGILLGGSATPREHRGKGAQARLLLHGLSVAAREGHRFAVATAAEGSPSLSNMRRTGFHVHVRQAWR